MSINIEASASTSTVFKEDINDDLSQLIKGWNDEISVVINNPFEVNDEMFSYSDCYQGQC